MKRAILLLSVLFLLAACSENKKERQPLNEMEVTSVMAEPFSEDTIVDADYTFEEALVGTKAPQDHIDQLVLFDVIYLSVDGKIHKGQILSNKKIADELKALFTFMLDEGFVVERAIPIVRYNWNDSLSMADNNSYSFCYRDISYSLHADGMAIDINPRFNPLRWKQGNRPNLPEGAQRDTTVNGTLHPAHPVVKEFKKRGFRWGHTFTKYYDDHHFEKKREKR